MSTLCLYESAISAMTGSNHSISLSNVTAALHIAYWSAGLLDGDEAITTPLTFAATANALVYQHVRPVFADIDPATLNLDVAAVKRAAGPKTRAVIAVDFAGLPCEYDALRRTADEHGWILVADA